jgi:Symplekin/PTA1 N-terminal
MISWFIEVYLSNNILYTRTQPAACLQSILLLALYSIITVLLVPCKSTSHSLITNDSSLVAIAKKRPAYYEHILSGLLSFDPSINSVQGAHSSNIRYNLRAGFIGFLRSTNPSMVEVLSNNFPLLLPFYIKMAVLC